MEYKDARTNSYLPFRCEQFDALRECCWLERLLARSMGRPGDHMVYVKVTLISCCRARILMKTSHLEIVLQVYFQITFSAMVAADVVHGASTLTRGNIPFTFLLKAQTSIYNPKLPPNHTV